MRYSDARILHVVPSQRYPAHLIVSLSVIDVGSSIQFSNKLQSVSDSFKSPEAFPDIFIFYFRCTGGKRCCHTVAEIVPAFQIQFANIHKKLFRSEEHTSELQSRGHRVCLLVLVKNKQ